MSCSVVTTRKRSYGKVMFSQASVCSGGGETSKASWDRSYDRVSLPRLCSLPAPPPNPCFPSPDIRPRDLPPPSENIRPIYPLVEITGDLSKLAHLGTYPPPPLHRRAVATEPASPYRFQVGGTHPTTTLSCNLLQTTFLLTITRFPRPKIVLMSGCLVWDGRFYCTCRHSIIIQRKA